MSDISEEWAELAADFKELEVCAKMKGKFGADGALHAGYEQELPGEAGRTRRVPEEVHQTHCTSEVSHGSHRKES